MQDAQLRLTYLSSRLEEKYGIDLASYLGAKRFEQPALNLTPEDWANHRAQLQRHEAFRDFEIHCRADDGQAVWLSLSGQPLFDDAGKFTGYLGVGRDITVQKRAGELRHLEHELGRILGETAAAEEAFQKLLATVAQSEDWESAQLWVADEAAKVLRPVAQWTRDALEPMAKGAFSAREPLGMGVGLAGLAWQARDVLWIANASEDPRAAEALKPEETGVNAALALPLRYAGRVAGMLELRARVVRARDEAFLETLAAVGPSVAAFLERSQIERARRDAEMRARSLSELSADWYWQLDASYAFTRLEGRNVAGGDTDLARRLIGIRRWESGLEVEGGWDAHRALLDARKPFHDVLMWRQMADGRTRYLRVSGEALFSADGAFVGYHGIGRDVTQQQRSDNLLRLEHGVARSLASAEDATSGLRAVILALCESEGWDAGRYFRVDEGSGALRFVDGWCVNQPSIDHFVERSRSVWQSGSVVWSSAAQEPQGAFAFAVVSGGNTLGVLAFSGSTVRAPDERLQQAARVIGSQVGQFLRHKQAEESLRESESRFRSLTQMSSDFFWETDAQHRFVDVVHGPNYAASQIGEGLAGRIAWEIPSVSPDESGWSAHRATLESHVPFRDFEFARAMSDGTTRYFTLSGEPRLAADGTFLGYRGVGRDVTESALTRERIASLAYRDPLTGLANRTSLGPALEQAVERARRRGFKLAGVFIDLDGFKQINDLHGHDAGDRCLIEVARRLRATVRASDVVGRLGGDEFFVLLEEVQDEAAVETVIRKLLAEAVRPYELPGGAQARLTASIGVSLFPDDATDAAALVKNADTAMYAAKQGGKNGYRFFSPEERGPQWPPKPTPGLNGPVRSMSRGSGGPQLRAAPAYREGK